MEFTECKLLALALCAWVCKRGGGLLMPGCVRGGFIDAWVCTRGGVIDAWVCTRGVY